MKKNFHDRVTNRSKPTSDQPMYQFFGEEVSLQEDKANVRQEIEETVVRVLDHSRMQKAGYWLMVGVLSILLILFVIKTNLSATVGSIMMIFLFLLGVRRIPFSYNADINFYLANVTVTLKAMFQHFSITSKLIKHADKILFVSVTAMLIEHLTLRWFLFAPISSAIYTVGFYGMWLGCILCFANRDTSKAYRGFALAYIYHLIVILFNGLFNNDLYIFTVVSAFVIWTIAGWMKKCAIEDIQITRKSS
ncbi:hypothetical protein JOD82_002254 [Paenibacillus sp. 1182]|uniref:hypothetical protein n=1 Tax=Paenibacillus sp. 1182 TaxID=2806565 RepID=UPI001AE7F27D|nr:hypothetical protein [Paenibacillus sp. 1182]MBP1309234.1 hypothetical protein [Paenibacillus sp. 1182]